MREVTYPIRTYERRGREEYVYKCAKCGKEVEGYVRSRIYGSVLCAKCIKARQNQYEKDKMERIRQQAADSAIAEALEKYDVETIDDLVLNVRRKARADAFDEYISCLSDIPEKMYTASALIELGELLKKQ